MNHIPIPWPVINEVTVVIACNKNYYVFDTAPYVIAAVADLDDESCAVTIKLTAITAQFNPN